MLLNIIQKALFNSKVEHFGLSIMVLNLVAKRVGISTTWQTKNSFLQKLKNSYITFMLTKLGFNVRELVLYNPSEFNIGLKRRIFKYIRVLKFNRTLRGVRHVQFLPVRGQRTKTNAKTQKSKR